MNNRQIADRFVNMVNGKEEKKTINGRNNLSIRVVGDKLALYSYATPIAVYNGTFVVVNSSSYSASTAKHQSHLNRNAFNCPVSVVCHFVEFGCSCGELLQQAAPLYSYKKETFHDCNGKPYTRYVLHKEGVSYGLHPYTKEQAAKDEMSRLNALAVGQLTNI